MKPADLALEPPAEIRFRRRVRLVPSVIELWHGRELVRSLAERELRLRYKQAFLGFAWAVLTPVTLLLVFTLFFNRVARVDTGGAPYALFAYLGVIPWTFFSTSVAQGGQSLVQNLALLNKVRCPREVFPIASVAVAGIDAVIATAVLVILFAVTGYAPRPAAVWAPLLLIVQVAFTLGLTLMVSAVVVYLRDLRHALPVLLQLGLFATPVAYGIEMVPPQWRVLYATLNPLAPVIDGYRRTILLGQEPAWALLFAGTASALVVLVVGYTTFKRLEASFADVA